MSEITVPFHRPDITREEIEAVVQTLENGWLTMGQVTFAFEEEFARYTGADHAVALNSCTSALHLALIISGIGPGDEVILPANTFVSTLEVVTYTGATPVLADVETSTHCMSMESLEEKISPKTRAVIPVHFSGHTVDMGRVMELSDHHGFTVIEDAAHTLPAWYRKHMAGTMGHLGCYSFYATKTITSGEGGMLVTGNKEWADRARMLRLHGISRDAWKRYDASGSWQYDVAETGYKYNITDIHAALGKGQLSRASQLWEQRRSIAARYSEAFDELQQVEAYHEQEWCRSSWHLYPLKVNLETLTIDRDRFISELRDRGITASHHFIPLYRFTAYSHLAAGPGDFPGSEEVHKRSLSLPIFPGMTSQQVDHVIHSVQQICQENAR